MSGIYVPHEEFPKDCWDCPFDTAAGCPFGGMDLDEAAIWHERIHPDCPLQFVQDHGELIDRDELLEKRWDADTRCGFVQVVDVGDIEEAPTVIPADRDVAAEDMPRPKGYANNINWADNFIIPGENDQIALWGDKDADR